MAENNHKLLVTIGAALSSGFNSAISGSTSKIKGLGAAIQEMEKKSLLSASSLEKVKGQYNSLLGSMNKQQAIIQKRGFYRSQILGVAALGAALAAPIKSAMDLEDSLAQIRQVVNFPKPEGLQQLGSELSKLSREIPLTSNQLAKIAAIGGQFGVSADELAKFSEEVGKTAVAWRAPAEETAERVGNLMKVFNVSTSELPTYFDAINELGNKTGATAAQILQAVNRSSDGLANFKLSIPQVAALTSTLISFGEGAETAGNSVSTMLQKLSIAPQLGENAKKALRSIGLSAVTLPKLIQEDPQKVIDKLLTGLSKLDPENRSSAMYNIFGRGASKAVGKLVENLELYRHNLSLVAEQSSYAGSRDGDYNIVLAETNSQIELLKNNFISFSQEIGASLLPTLKEVVSAINGVLSPIMDWMSKNKELTATIMKTVAGFISFRIATFALGYASTFLFGGWNRIVILFKSLRLGLTLLGTAFKSYLGWPIAFATAAWIIWDNWETIQEFFKKIWEPIEPYWNAFKEKIDELGITSAITDAWEAVQNFFKKIWDSVSPIWDSFIKKIKSFTITQKIIDAWESVKNFFKKFFAELTPLWNKFTAPISNLWSGAKNLVSKVGSALGFGDSKSETTLKIPEMKQIAPEVSREQNNNFNITINSAKNDNAESISDKVMKKVSNYSRAFLYDPVPEVL